MIIPGSAILVVDDNDDMREALVTYFTGFGARVYHSSDGAEAIHQLHKHGDIALIITDILMPHVDGVALAIYVHKHFPRVKIIAFSGGGIIPGKTYLSEMRQLGAHEVFEKPIRMSELTAAIDRL